MRTPYKSLEDITSLVHDLLENTTVTKIPYIDVTELAIDLGYEVLEVEFDDPDISGVITTSKNKRNILISYNDTEQRKRFSIAHELGHAILHHSDTESDYEMIDYRKPRNEYLENPEILRKEFQANYFAASLLMPVTDFEKVYKRFQNPIDVANYFNVSVSAVTRRMDTLGL